MSEQRKFCARCGAAVGMRIMDGHSRQICLACEAIFYENPLPVAAAVVLNERREVLLIRRDHDPHAGEWSLPMGFAELGETISQAALRELREEAGIDGDIIRLLSADSESTDRYGDLLIVSFEVRKTGGVEQAGDDAEEARYFPIGRHPNLPFTANENAVRACADANQPAWLIHDSFITLQGSERKAMLSDALAELIPRQAERVVGVWLDELLKMPSTQSYHVIEREALESRAQLSIEHFGRWLRGEDAPGELEEFYRRVGADRQAEGLPVHEVFSALTLLKKHLWNAAHDENVREKPIDLYRLLEFSRRMAVFFDKACYHIARGYAAETPRTPARR